MSQFFFFLGFVQRFESPSPLRTLFLYFDFVLPKVTPYKFCLNKNVFRSGPIVICSRYLHFIPPRPLLFCHKLQDRLCHGSRPLVLLGSVQSILVKPTVKSY